MWVVADDHGDLAPELLLPLAQEQIVEAVGRLAHQERDPLHPVGEVHRPFHAQGLGKGTELLLQDRPGGGEIPQVELDPQEETAAPGIRVLLAMQGC